MDTMATSAEMTMAIVRAVDLPNVGVLYDQANLAFMNSEVFEMAIALQGPRIQHVHVKDFYWRGTERIAAVLGQGIMPWEMIIASLNDLGYEGFYSLEYERRWFPDQLPPPAVGMQQVPGFPARDRSLGAVRQWRALLVRNLVDWLAALIGERCLHHFVKSVLRMVTEHRARLFGRCAGAAPEGHRHIAIGPPGCIGQQARGPRYSLLAARPVMLKASPTAVSLSSAKIVPATTSRTSVTTSSPG